MWPSERRPLLLAHRGFHLRERENTIGAFAAAQETGADGIEFDVRSTRDGALVLHHDPRLGGRRLLGTLRRAQTPSWMPTLDDVLRWAAAQPHLLLDVELKEPGMEGEVLRLVRRYRVGTRCIVSSFEPDVVSSVRGADPGAPAGLIVSRPSRQVLQTVTDLSAQLLVVPEARASRTLIESARQSNIEVWVWGPGTSAVARRLAGLGVEGFIVDRPDRIAQAIDPFRSASDSAPFGRSKISGRRGRPGN